ncbi:hypothetical protein [Marinobacter sp. X15-166B]|uniref:hypothetical protein n=1 Tax=Marinobacter sp. X15-166B TaxID=1897620 RepID=UPI000AA0F3E9|nr:hypothetical protein [Marinobacter sp. X15-166B]
MTHLLNPEAVVKDGRWNTPYTFNSGETQYHELAQLRLWVTMLDSEWQIRVDRSGDEPDRLRWSETVNYVLPGTEVTLQRFMRPEDKSTVVYLPVMAKLPTVIRPYQPLTILAGGECTIYVGTVVWMRICVGPQRQELVDLPLSEPSLTWVGPSTMEGDLCYTAPSYARLLLDAVPRRPWRAVTPVRIRNRRDEPLLVERFSLPTRLLSLHENEHGELWTPRVTVTCETEMNSARLKIDKNLIELAGNCTLIAPARDYSERVYLHRAIDRMFG